MAAGILVRERKSANRKNTFEYRFEAAPINGKRQWKSKGGYPSAKEARKAGIAALAEYNACGCVIQPTEMSFSDFLDFWMEHDCQATLKQSTVVNYQKKIRNHIKPALGEYRMRNIQWEQLQDLLRQMHDAGYAHNTLLGIKGILTKCFRYAVERKYIAHSPTDGLKLPTSDNTAVPTRSAPHAYLSRAQMQMILQRFPEGTPSHLPLMLGYHCGLRIGEAFALTWEDIDLENHMLTVNRQVQWHQNPRSKEAKTQQNGHRAAESGYWYFTQPKYNSVRSLDINAELTDLLKREKSRQEAAESYFAERYSRYYLDFRQTITQEPTQYPVHFICVRENGSYVNSRTMQHTSAIIQKKLGIPEFDYHSLRHTHATMLVEHGSPLKYVQKRLGHKNLTVTMNTYQHFTERIQQQGREVVNLMYANRECKECGSSFPL